MKVKELIKRLKKLDQDAHVVVPNAKYNYWYEDLYGLDVVDIDEEGQIFHKDDYDMNDEEEKENYEYGLENCSKNVVRLW